MLIQTRCIVHLELHKDTNNLKNHCQDVIANHVPKQTHVARLLQALCVLKGYYRKSFDITLAYTHSELPPGRLIALKCPIGYRRKNANGEELYMLLKKNLYGAYTHIYIDAAVAYHYMHIECMSCIMYECVPAGYLGYLLWGDDFAHDR